MTLQETGDKDQVFQAEKGISSKSYDISFILTALREKGKKIKEHWELRHCKTKNRELKAAKESA